jgi:hypothetical protein
MNAMSLHRTVCHASQDRFENNGPNLFTGEAENE